MRHWIVSMKDTRGKKCDECGEIATITLIAEYADYDGTLAEMSLCNTHADEYTKKYGDDFPQDPDVESFRKEMEDE